MKGTWFQRRIIFRRLINNNSSFIRTTTIRLRLQQMQSETQTTIKTMEVMLMMLSILAVRPELPDPLGGTKATSSDLIPDL